MVRIDKKTDGLTYLTAKSTDVIMINYTDNNKNEVYISKNVGVWDDNNPKEDSVLTNEETIDKDIANAQMNINLGTTNVVYFQ